MHYIQRFRLMKTWNKTPLEFAAFSSASMFHAVRQLGLNHPQFFFLNYIRTHILRTAKKGWQSLNVLRNFKKTFSVTTTNEYDIAGFKISFIKIFLIYAYVKQVAGKILKMYFQINKSWKDVKVF